MARMCLSLSLQKNEALNVGNTDVVNRIKYLVSSTVGGLVWSAHGNTYEARQADALITFASKPCVSTGEVFSKLS